MPGHFHFFAYLVNNDHLIFDSTESTHISQVLRYQIGDTISATDGKGNKYQAQLTEVTKKQVVAHITHTEQVKATRFLQLAIGVLKNTERMEWLVEKCTELQVHSLVFVASANSQKRKLNVDRLIKKSIAAVKQSHGAFVPTITVSNLESVFSQSQTVYIAHCQPAVKVAISSLPATATLLIGPEGDFTAKEIELAIAHNAIAVDLGNSILRAETAAVAAASVHYLLQ